MIARSDYWLSNSRMTVRVTVDALSKIVSAAPIVRRFVGQPLSNLTRWMNKQGKTKIVLLRAAEL
jgi:hypothetical protein